MSNVSPVAIALAECVQRWWTRVLSSSGDCRVVLPAPTKKVAKELHFELRRRNLPSYLVVGSGAKSETPSEAERILRAEAVTSVRDGSFVAVIEPGVLSKLQESIKGSGGGIRSVAISDEWPWAKAEAGFDFFDDFFPNWISASGFPDSDVGVAEGLLKLAIESTEPVSARSDLLFDEVLAQEFDDKKPAALRVDQFAMALGVPSINAPSVGGAGIPEAVLRDVALASKVAQAMRGESAREAVNQNAANALLDLPESDRPDVDDLKRMLNGALDRFRVAKQRVPGSLSLRTALPSNHEEWRLLTIGVLKRVFVQTATQAAVTLKAEWDGASGIGHVPPGGRHCVVAGAKVPLLKITISRDAQHQAQLELKLGRKSLRRETLSPGQENITFELDSDELPGGSSVITIAAKVDQSPLASTKVFLERTTESSSSFLVSLEHTPEMTGVRSISRYDCAGSPEEEESIDIDRFTRLLAVSSDPSPRILLNGGAIATTMLAPGVHWVELDPAVIEGSGVPPELSLVGAGEEISVSLVADGGRAGVCNLETAFVDSLQGARQGREAESLLGAWLGKVDARPLLGTPSSAQDARFNVAVNAFESADEPWLPVGLDSRAGRGSRIVRHGWLRLAETESALRSSDMAASTPLSSEVCAAIDAYSRARARLIGEIAGRHRGKALHGLPLYAAASFHYEDNDAIDGAIKSYLDRFSEIQRMLGDGRLSYRDRFVLAYLDCVVATVGTDGMWGLAGAALGPWHPLVVAKRMMVGRGVLHLSTRSARSEAAWLRRLGVLLKDVTGFRWFAGIQAGSEQVVPFFVNATSDPGWLVAMPASDGAVNQADDVFVWARESLGLEVLLGGGSGASSFTGYLLDFTRAFPSKRSVVVRASHDAPSSGLVTSARTFLTSNDGMPTVHGSALSGGIHIVIDGDGGSPEDYPDWAEPVVSLYPNGGAGFVERHKTDLLLMQAASTTSYALLPAPASEKASPRGHGLAAVLQLPEKALLQTGFGVMDTRLSYNSDAASVGEGLGEAYAGAVWEAQRATGPARSLTIRTIQAVHGANAATWTVLPGDSVDPAVLLEWARSTAVAGSPRVLWDYRMALTQSYRTYYVLSEIPRQLLKHVTASPVFGDERRAGEALMELASIGLALGAEAFKSRSRALGVVGLMGAARVALRVLDAAQSGAAISCRFLLPVDSFQDLLGGEADGASSDAQADYRRSDLIGVVCRIAHHNVEIAFCSIESKYSTGQFSEGKANAAIEQANRSLTRLLALASAANQSDALAERLALARLMEFGLRLDRSMDPSVVSSILSAVLRGEHQSSVLGATGCLVVSTETGLDESSTRRLDQGVWVRLSPNQWPSEKGDGEFARVASAASAAMRSAWQERQDASIADVLASREGQFGQAVPSEPPEATVGSARQQERPSASTGSLQFSADSGSDTLGVQDDSARSEQIAQPSGDPAPTSNKPIQILLGVGEDGKPVTWKAGENSNHNFMVTGSSGLGKTQLLKSMLWQLRAAGLPALVLDFKNDFASDRDFLERASLDVQYVGFEGLPYNPLIPCPQPDPRTGAPTYMPGQHVTGIVSAFQRTYGLGEQQAADLRESIRAALDEAGLPLTGVVDRLPEAFPDFAIVGEHLKVKNRLAYNRLDPLFDLEIFRENYRATPFNDLLGRGYVLDLSGIQAEHIQNTLAALLVYSAHRYLNSLPHAPSINQVLVFDEAHRVLKSEDVGRLVRECRAYGLGVVLSSQYPTDFPPDTAANLATKVLHGNGPDVARIQGIRSMLGLATDADKRLNMPMFHAAALAQPGKIAFASTLGYPHRVLLEALRQGPVEKAILRQVKGIHLDKLEQTLEHLAAMRLVSVSGEIVRLNQ